MKISTKCCRFHILTCCAMRSIQARVFGSYVASPDQFSHLPNLNSSNLHIEYNDKEDERRVPTPKELIGKWGAIFTDNMLEIHWDDRNGFSDPKIVKHGDITLSPAAKCLHYGLQVFEGLKAYRDDNNQIRLFRPVMNIERFNRGLNRLCLPMVDVEEMLELIKRLVMHEERWVLSEPGCSLYLRPFAIGTEPCISAKASRVMRIYCICSPVGPYFPIGTKPARLMVDTENVRAWPGGIGFCKAGGNYAPTMLPAVRAREEHSCDQALFVCGPNHVIQEAGAMNFFSVFQLPTGDIELVTPSLEGKSILPGVTRDSIIEIVTEWGKPFRVTEREITMGEIEAASQQGTLLEVFVCGTGAVVCPVKGIVYEGREIFVPTGESMGRITNKVLQQLTNIQYGKLNHPKWSVIVHD